jgi:hypothetical protein
LPDEVSVSDCVFDVFSGMEPKLRLAVLTLRPRVSAFSCSAVWADTPFAVAVMVALSVVVTAEAVAVKAAVVAPLATVTDAGTITALLLLLRFTGRPPLLAAEVRVTVQASVVAPVSELLLHETALGAEAETVWPVPLRLTVATPPAVALLLMVSVSARAPAVVGSKVIAIVAV